MDPQHNLQKLQIDINFNYYSDEFIDYSPNSITDSIFLGPEKFALNDSSLVKRGITHIVNVSSTSPCKYPEKYKYLHLPLQDRDDFNIRKYLDPCVDFIDEVIKNGGKVYIHCFAGISRSSTVVIYYLMKHKKMRFEDAFEFVKKKRPIACPNFGFLNTLIELDKDLIIPNFNVDTTSSRIF
jgi:protein-tyrosine phosphatase